MAPPVPGCAGFRRGACLPHPTGDVAYWIVPAGRWRRHATTVKPGAVPDGQLITLLCRVQAPWPFCTPLGRQPRSLSITEECERCRVVVIERGLASASWDG